MTTDFGNTKKLAKNAKRRSNTNLERLSSFLMGGTAQVDSVDTEDLVSSPQLTALISRPTRQNERHKDTFTIFPSDNVEAQPRIAFVKYNCSNFPATIYKTISNLFIYYFLIYYKF